MRLWTIRSVYEEALVLRTGKIEEMRPVSISEMHDANIVQGEYLLEMFNLLAYRFPAISDLIASFFRDLAVNLTSLLVQAAKTGKQ